MKKAISQSAVFKHLCVFTTIIYFYVYVLLTYFKKLMMLIGWWTVMPIICGWLLTFDKLKKWRVRIYG